MKLFHRLLILIAAAGLFSGLAVRRSGSRGAGGREISGQDAGRSPGEIASAAGPLPAVRVFPPRHSTDTVETLAAIDDAHLYTRLALWLVDAGEADIAAFWSGYSEKEDYSEEIYQLVFLNWTRINPQAAIAAAGIEDYNAWWAWTCHDPQAALAAALTAGPKILELVAMGIGEFHPEWLKAHSKEIPESFREYAFQTATNRQDAENPLEALKSSKEHDIDPNFETLEALARQDPWAALEWAKKYPDDYPGDFKDTMDLVLQTMAAEHPEDLRHLLAQTPSGETKLKMEAALFANLLKTDPAAALEQAAATTIPRTAVERYAAIGLDRVTTDPEQAFQLAQRIFSIGPDALEIEAKIEYPGGSSTSSLDIPGFDDFMESLMAKDPARLMDAAFSGTELQAEPFTRLSDHWVQQDFPSYVDWVNRQADGEIRETGATVIANQLQNDGQFAEACEWTMSMKDGGKESLPVLLRRWNSNDPEAAAQWLESSDIPAERRAALETEMQKPW
ncbi:MAG: hypothetical protein ABIS50_00120 [Luteolibacter sp.]|uniref:hypothetical protein n=1 Tax=Luteolibacter sp. TaxID=1962973 RepID=UPI0032642BC0